MRRILPLLAIFILKVSLLYGQADHMVISTQPTQTIAGQSIAGHPEVTVFESDGTTGVGSIDVTVSVNKGSISTGTFTITTDGNGIAAFTDLIIELADTGYELTFDADAINVDDVTSNLFEVTPAVPDYMTIIQQPQNTLQEQAIDGPSTVTLYDEYGNTISGIDITAKINKNSFSGGSAVTVATNSTGQAIFSDLIIDDFDTGYEITFDADDTEASGADNIVSDPFEIYEEKFIITIQNQPIHSVADYPIEGADIINPIRVRVADMSDNPVASGTVNVALNTGSFATGSITSASINSGIAIFDNLIIDLADIDYQLIFSNSSVHIADVTSNAFNVVAEGATMIMDVNTIESIEGIPLYGPLSVYVEDSGTPQAGVGITAHLSSNDFTVGSTITEITDGNGLAVFDNLVVDDIADDYQIFFKALISGIATITSNVFDVKEEVAIMAVNQQPELTIAGETVNGVPAVSITEKATGDPALAQIRASLNTGYFSTLSDTLATTVDGVAEFSNLIIDTPGDYTIIFSVPGASGIDTVMTVEFEVLAVAGNMSVSTQPEESSEGNPVNGPPTVTILEIDDTTPMEGIPVTAILNKNGFVSGETTVNTNASGQAVFDDLIIDDVDTGYSITFDVPVSSGVVGKTSNAFNVVEELALLSVEVQPTLTIDGEVINGYPTVKITDKNSGLPINNVDIYVSLNKNNFAGGTLTRKTNSEGLAVFNDLIVDTPDDDYHITFSTQTTNVADISTDAFNVIPVTGTMTITTQPEESIEGYILEGPPTIRILDPLDAPLSGIQVTAILSDNDFAIGSTAQLNTDIDGFAVFENLTINDAAGGYTITFDVAIADGVVSKTSDEFDVVEEFAVLSFEEQPTLTVSGETINGPPQVKIINKETSDPIPSINIYASLSKGSFKASSSLMVTTNASGIATFNNLIIDDDDTDYQLTFSTQSSGIADIISNEFDVIPLTGEITIPQQPQETVDGYVITGPPTIQILDTLTNPMENIEVTVTINKNSIASGTLVRLTNDQGIAVFDDLILSDPAIDYELSFTVNPSQGIPNQISNTFRVVAEVAIIEITQEPSLTIAGELINGPPTVLLKDPGGSPISGGNITVSLSNNSFAGSSTTTVTTDGSGIAVFDNLTIDVADIDYQLIFSTSSSGVEDQISANFDVVEPQGIITISQQPGETVDGQPIAGPPTVNLTETNGDPWTGAEVTVTVSVNKNDLSSGTLSKETVGGVAVFDNLILNDIDTNYELTFSLDISERIANITTNPFDVVAVAGYLNVSTQPSETVEGDPINGPPVVRLTNLLNHGVSGVTISVTLNKSDFTGGSTTTAITNFAGYAIFSNLVIDDFDTGYNLTFTAIGASGVASVISNDFEVTDATLSMDIVQQPTETVAGVSISPAPQVHIHNGVGDIEGAVVTAYINKNTFSGGSTLTATTNSSGIATFNNLIINTADNNYSISFNADYTGVKNANSSVFTITPSLADYIEVTSQPGNSTAGETIEGPPAATAYDEFGNPVPNVDIEVEPNQHSGSFSGTTPVSTNASGVAVFNDLVITTSAPNYQLFFTSSGVTTANSNIFAISNAVPHHISIITQPSETVAGAAISGPPVVVVEDEYGNPVQGETITISIVEGYSIDAGTLSFETPANGVVSFSDLVINTVGTYTFRFVVDGIEATSSSFSVVQGTMFSRFFGASHSGFISHPESAIPLRQTPTRIEVIIQPMETVVGTEIIGPPRIAVYDAVDRPVPNVSVTVTGVTFSAGAETLTTNSSGEITFSGLTIDATGTYNLTFTADNYAGVFAESNPFDVIDAIATMSMSVQPQQTVSGQSVEGHPTVQLVNSIGMPVPDVEITVYINQNSFGGGSVTTVTTDASGLAEFDELYISQVASGYQFIFNADYSGVQNITSSFFNVVNAPPHSMTVTRQPLETIEGATISGPPTVTVYDEYGNTVAGISVTVTEVLEGVSIDAGISTLTTNSSGVASFSTLILNNRGTYQLSFEASGIPTITSNIFQVVSGTVANRFKGTSHSGFTSFVIPDQQLGQTPARIEVISQPLETVADYIIEGPPSVRVYDDIDNPMKGVEVTVSVLDGGDFSSGTVTRTTNNDGEITFNNLVISDEGRYRLNFSAINHLATVSDEQSNPFDVTSQVYFMDIVAQPETSIAGETIAGPPLVRVTNSIYQPLAGVDVTVYINQHSFASGSFTVETDIDGYADFDDLVINTAAEGYQLIFDADYSGITNEISATFNVSNAAPSNISITAQPATTVEGAAILGPPTIRLSDEFDNPVANTNISIAETGGYSFNGGTTLKLTNASGVATFDDIIINTMGQYSLTFSSDDVEDAVSMNFNVTSGNVANRFYGNTHSGFVSFEIKDKALGQIPARIEIVTQPQETVLGDITGVYGPPTIMVYDEVDNPMGGVIVNVSASGVGISDGVTTGISQADGTISFPGLIIDEVGTYQLTFVAQDYPAISATSSVFDVVSPNLFMSIDTQPGETIAGQTVDGYPTVRVFNAANQGFEGIDVTVYINQHSFESAPETQTVTTDASGLAVFDELVINIAATGYQLLFDADYSGVVNISSDAFSVIPAAPNAISIIQQPQDTEAGATIVGPPDVSITDEFGNIISGISVFVTETGGYSFDGGAINQITNASGIASFPDLVIDDPGLYSLTFSAAGVSNEISNNFNVFSGTVSNRFKGSSHSGFTTRLTESQHIGQTPARIDVLAQPMETITGYEIEGPPRIIVYDEFDRPMGGVSVTVSTGQAFTAGSSNQLISNSSGEITWDNLILDTPGIYNLTFTVDFYAPEISAQSAQFEVISPQLFLTISEQPAETVAGQTIAGPPTARLATSLGQGQEGIDVTVFINQNSFTSGIETQTVTTDVQGYAEFDQLVISTAATGYQLIFDADIGGVVNIISDAFNVVNGAPHSMTVTTQPMDTEDGAVVAGPPTVTVYDEFGNTLPGISVSVEETGGYIFPGGTLTQITNAYGVAIFDNLLMEEIGNFSLTFSVAGIADVVSDNFRVYSGNVSNRFKGASHSGFDSDAIVDAELGQQPTRIEIMIQPQETISGDAIEGPPLVVVYDEMDNPVGGITINVSIAGEGGPIFAGGSITDITTGINGEAEFGLLIVEITGSFTLRFEADGYDGIVPDAISQSFDVVDPLLNMEITEQPTETVAGEAVAGPPTVRLTTVGTVQQPFAGVEVTAYINQNVFSDGTQTVFTNDQGYAIFDDLVIETAAAGYQIIFDADYSGVVNQISNAFTVVPGPASQITMVTQPLDAQAGEIIGGPPIVALYDAFNNPVPEITITLTEQGGYSLDGGTTTQNSGANGYASFSDLMISTPGYYILNFDAAAAGVPDIQSQQFRILSNELSGRFKGASHSGFTQLEEKDVLLKQVPTYIEILTQPSQTISGEPVEGHPRVAVYDQLYQPISNADIIVSVVGGTNPAMTGNMNLQTGANGEVIFNNLIIQEIKEHRLYFEVGGYNHVNATSQLFEVIAPLLTMDIHIQPAVTQAGEIIEGNPSGFPAVIITDGMGNGANGIEVSVFLNQFAFDSDPGFATATTDEFGVAQFNNLFINHASDNYQMLFEANTSAVNSVTSNLFTILPGPPHTLIIATQPQSSEAGAAIAGPPAAGLYDVFNNSIAGASISVSEAGSEPLGGTNNVNTNSNGIAIFSNLTIDNPGTYQLVFDNDDVDLVTSFSFVVSSSHIVGRFRGNTHSGFTSKLIDDVPLFIPDSVETPIFTNPVAEMCEGTTEIFTATAEHSDSLKYYINPASFGTIDDYTGELTLNMGFHGTLYIVANAFGHGGPVKDSVLVTVIAEVDMPQFDDPVTSICQGVDETTQYTATTVQPSAIDYSVLPVEAGSINVFGIITWDSGFSGDATILATATATNGCGDPKTSSVAVTVNSEIGNPTFTQGAVEVCQDAPNETYQAISSDSENIVYSLSDVAAGSLNQNTGVMNWDAYFHGIVTITATATGCGGPKTVDREITVHPAPSASAISGDSSVECNAVGEVYSVDINAGSSYVWTVPTGATITAGEVAPGNNSITVDFGENNGNVSVVETTTHGCVGASVSLMVTLDGCGMQADFTASETEICEGGSITFTDNSTASADIDTWVWSFGAGANPTGASTQGPHTVTFNNEGTYNVSLTVTDGVASDTHEIEVAVLRWGVWLGTEDVDWFNPANWTCATVPTNSIDVTILAGAAHYPEITGSTANARNINIENGAELTINGQTLNVYGNWFNDGTFNAGGIVVFHGSPSTIGGVSSKVFNSIVVASSATLSAPDNLIIEGDLLVNGTFTHNNGRIVFTGGSKQIISGSTGSLTMHTFEIDRSLSDSLILDRNVDIVSELLLTQGVVYTSSSKMLRLDAGASSTEGSNISHVDGPIQKRGENAFIFPTGNHGIWAPIGISAPGAPAETFVAQYFFTGHPESAKPDTEGPCNNCVEEDSIRVVIDTEYWTLNRTGGSSNPDATMYFKDLTRSGISSLANVVYAHWDGSKWGKLGKGVVSDGINAGYITGTDFISYNVHAPALALVEAECSAILSLESPASGIACDGDIFELSVELTGQAPFSITYSNGEGDEIIITAEEEDIDDGVFIIQENAIWQAPDPFGPMFEYTYSIVEIVDNNGCTSVGEGSAVIEVWKRPETGPQFHIPNTYGR